MVLHWSNFCTSLCAVLLLFLLTIPSGQGQGQLQFLGEPPFRAYASRSTLVGQVLYRLFTVDDNSDVISNGLTYSIEQSSSEHFNLHPDTGELVLSTPFSSLMDHTLVLQASSVSHSTVQAMLVVTVVPESDMTPRYEREAYNLSVSEGHPVGRPFSIVRVFPLSSISSPTYSIVSETGGGIFSVDPNNGLLTITQSLDREQIDRYALTVRYSYDRDKFVDTEVLISVTDVNDNPPLFTRSLYNVTVPENVAVPISILTLSAMDLDIGINSRVRYSFDDPPSEFSLDSETGIVSVLLALDHERASSYQLSVTASDTGEPPASSTAVLVISVGNIDDECPVFENQLYIADIAGSEVQAGQEILTVVARDPDNLSGVSYSVVSSNADGILSLDPNTGVLSVASAASLSGQYSLNISTSDGSCLAGSYASVMVRIMDDNAHRPEIVTQCNAMLPENSPTGTEVITLQANDPDTGLNGQVTFSLLNTSYFSISPTTGVVVTNQIPERYNRETQEVFEVGVIAVDGGLRQDYCLLTITLSDKNDNRPNFLLQEYNISLAPNTAPMTVVGVVTAFDADVGSNGNISYTLSNPTPAPFAIDPCTGEIRTTAPVNDISVDISLSVTARDMGNPVSLSSTALVHLSLLPGAPVFSQTYYNVTICENTPANKPILTLEASFTPTFQLLSGSEYSSNSEGTFTLTGNIIRVSSEDIPNYESLSSSRRSFLFPVLATNSLGRSTAIVEIFLADLDDNSPEVDSGFSFTLAENQPAGVVVTQILAHDPDSGTNGEIAYRLEAPSTLFNVSSTGVVRSLRMFDFEGANEVLSGTLRVQLFNPNPPQSAEALREFCGNDVFLLPQNTVVNVMWSITDQNDNPPSFERTVYSVQLPEDQPTLTSVFTFNATDLDASDRQSGLNFLITSGNEEGTFAIDGNSLVLIGRLDFERTTSYDLLVLVTDGIHSRGNACPRCMASLVITVSDIDDESPVFASSTHQLDVVEQLPVGTTILTLSAQDVDTPTIRYQLSGQAQGRLNISNSGEIIVSGDLDREELENGTLPFLVFAEGGGIGVTEVFINLLDINDHAPRFLEVFGGRVQENTPPGDEGIFVTNVQAQDSDAGQNGTVTYSLVDEMESGFEIDSDTGVITANMEFDREAQSVYYLTVQASDNGVPSQLTSVTIVTVSIDDVNDNAPFFPFPYMFARVFEDATIGSHVLNIPVVDPDASSNLNFTLLSASPLGLYALDPDTGEVMVAGSLDYELPLHRNTTLRIALQDDVFTAEMIGVLTILLLDRNDNAPIVDPPVYSSVVGSTRMVAETLPPGQLLASLSADDVDEGSNGELVYSIVSGDERGDFNVSSRGRVSNTRQLDYETTNQYTLTVAVSDKGDPSLSSLVTLEFNIQDINDNTPSFSQNVYLVDIQENAEPTGSVFRISATDPDTNQGGQIGAYAIVSGNEGSEFILNATSGVLGTSVSFDREMTDSYMLVVTATDRGADPQTGTGTIVVTITDQNDNPSLSGGVQYVYINATNGQIQPGPIGQVYFRDPDISNTFTACMLQDFSFTSLFAVSSSDCSLSLLQSEIEEGTYPLPIIGRDGVHTSVTTSIIVIVEHISNETYPEGGVVTLTLNASAREYYELRLNVTIPDLLAQQLGVELRDVHVISLQPGYHNPIRTIDMTISATGAEGVLISPIEVLNRLFQNREQLFLAGRGVLSLPTDPCVAEPCSNQARCVARRAIDIARPALVTEQYILVAPRVTLDFECECVPGTSGESCEINFDDCYSAPCLHAAVCTDLVQGFVCDCPDGTSGSDCSFNPDECASNPCLNNAECVNGLGTYICSCLPGFYGRECQYARFQISPTCDSSLCLNGAACSPGRDSFTCLCAEGFNGTLCETPVQLQGGCVGNPCHNGSRCVDTAEGARCLCSPGFTGPFCRWPLDNCELEPCRNGATCEMGHYGSFLCTCAEGYTGENCTERVPACESTPCLNGGRCNDLQDSGFICQCTRNFTGEHCETPLLPPDLCEVDPAPCPLDANCTAGISATTCTCPPDLYGPDCSIVTMNDACSSNPCLHGSQCELAPPPLNYSCSCSVGYTGVNCEVNIDDCVSEPCLNGGRCEDGVGGYVCECGEGMTGDVCQIFCPDGQQGEFCEVGMSQCILASCSNGGTCMETLREGGAGGMIQCQCPDTHIGPTCDVPNDCSTTRCLNGGTCSSLPSGGVECQCPGGFDGPNCELVAVTFTGGSTRSSYRAYQPLELQGRGRVRLEFVTRSSRGLLLFSTQYQAGVSRDWLAVEVVEERVRVSVALGSGGGEVVVMGSSVRVSDGLWHQVSVETSGKVRGEGGREGGREGEGREGGKGKGGREEEGGGGGREGEGGRGGTLCVALYWLRLQCVNHHILQLKHMYANRMSETNCTVSKTLILCITK